MDGLLSGQRGCWLAWLHILSVLWLHLKGTIFFAVVLALKKKKKSPWKILIGLHWEPAICEPITKAKKAGCSDCLGPGLEWVRLGADGAGGELDLLPRNKAGGFLGGKQVSIPEDGEIGSSTDISRHRVVTSLRQVLQWAFIVPLYSRVTVFP